MVASYQLDMCLLGNTSHCSSSQPTNTPAPNQAGDVRQTGVSTLRYVALFIFVVLSAIQNLVWICFSTILDDAKTYYSINDAQVSVWPCCGCECDDHAVGVTVGLAVG